MFDEYINCIRIMTHIFFLLKENNESQNQKNN